MPAFEPITAVLNIGSQLIDKFFPDPQQKAEAKQKLLELQQNGELAELTASAGIVQTEAKSEHFLTSTWRPITMLVFVVIIANNYILAPYLDAIFNSSVSLEIPPDMWSLLKIGLGGYVIGRSAEKTIPLITNGLSKKNGN